MLTLCQRENIRLGTELLSVRSATPVVKPASRSGALSEKLGELHNYLNMIEKGQRNVLTCAPYCGRGVDLARCVQTQRPAASAPLLVGR